MQSGLYIGLEFMGFIFCCVSGLDWNMIGDINVVDGTVIVTRRVCHSFLAETSMP